MNNSYILTRLTSYTEADLTKAGWLKITPAHWKHDNRGDIERDTDNGNWYLTPPAYKKSPRVRKRVKLGSTLNAACHKLNL